MTTQTQTEDLDPVVELAQQAPNGELEDSETTRAPALGKRFFNLRTLISFALGFTIIAFLFTRVQIDVGAILDWVRQANPALLVAATVAFYATFPVRALRWKRLLGNVALTERGRLGSARRASSLPVAVLSEIIFLGWFANCIVPAKLGDAYRAYLLKLNAGVSFSTTIGTILAERIIDMLLLFVLLAGSVLLAFHGALPSVVLGIMQVGLVLVCAVIVGLFAMRNLSGHITRLVPRRFRHQYGLFEEGTLGSFQALPLVLLYSLVGWGIEASRLYLVCLSLGLFLLSPPIVLFVALASALLTTLPVTPAGLGFVESAIVGILILAAGFGLAPGVDENVATSVAILDRTISYWSLVLVGLGLYFFTRRS